MSAEKKIGVIGTGYWGKNLVRNFTELGVISAVSDTDEQMLGTLAQTYNISARFTNPTDLINLPEIDAVAIAAPAVNHYELVHAALTAGKDVFVEKPLALDVADAQRLIDLADSTNRILMVDHLLQYHPAVISLKKMIDEGKLGKLRYIYSNRLNIGKLRTEENILWSFAPHDISVILYLVEKFPKDVRAFGEAYLQDGVYDTTVTNLDFSDRLKAHIFVSWLHPFKDQKLVVIGDGGMAVFDDMSKDQKLIFFPHKVEWIKQRPVASKADLEVIPIESKEPLREACQHFLNCIQQRKKPKTDGVEALNVLKVIAAAQDDLDGKRK